MASITKKAGYRLFKMAQDFRAMKVMGNSENDNAVLEILAQEIEKLNPLLEGFDKSAVTNIHDLHQRWSGATAVSSKPCN